VSPWGKKTVAVVTVTTEEDRRPVDSETRVRTLEELFAACRDAPPSKLVRITILGDGGEVRLHFASFQRRE
jgi:hypothetical protein